MKTTANIDKTEVLS